MRRPQLLASLYGLLVLAIVVAAGIGGTNTLFSFVLWIPYGDKLGHFLVFGGLALSSDLAAGFRDLRLGALRAPLAPLMVTIAVTLEELSQRWLPHTRSFDLLDLAANLCGVALFSLLGRALTGKSIALGGEALPVRPSLLPPA